MSVAAFHSFEIHDADFFIFLLDDFFDFFFFLRSRLESDESLDEEACRRLRFFFRRDFSSESDELLSDSELLLELLLLVVLLDQDRFLFLIFSDFSFPETTSDSSIQFRYINYNYECKQKWVIIILTYHKMGISNKSVINRPIDI